MPHAMPVHSCYSLHGEGVLIGLVCWFLALNGTPKCMRRRKKRNKMREQQDSPPGLDSTVTAEAEEQGEAKGRRMEEREAPDAAASGMRACLHPLTLP